MIFDGNDDQCIAFDLLFYEVVKFTVFFKISVDSLKPGPIRLVRKRKGHLDGDGFTFVEIIGIELFPEIAVGFGTEAHVHAVVSYHVEQDKYEKDEGCKTSHYWVRKLNLMKKAVPTERLFYTILQVLLVLRVLGQRRLTIHLTVQDFLQRYREIFVLALYEGDTLQVGSLISFFQVICI